MRSTVYYFSGISFLTLTLVTTERYLAVCRPIKHSNEMTQSRMARIAWLLFPIFRFVFPEFYRFFGLLIVAIFAINAFLYVKIRRRVSRERIPVMTWDYGRSNGKRILRRCYMERFLRQFLMQMRVAQKIYTLQPSFALKIALKIVPCNNSFKKEVRRLATTVACLMLVMILAYQFPRSWAWAQVGL